MADFDPPFADQGERRLPSSTEQQLGFPCGPASRELFNGLFWLLQGQIKDIASEAGVIPSQEGDITLLKRAVLALIDAATGGGTADNYILMDQARSRLPIYPDVQHETGHLGVLSPSTGTVRVPGSRTFLHRGIFPVTTVQTDFATDSSKTYHLRWNPTDGFVLRDLASGTYNPGTLAEADPSFDSGYDDMLVARVITNSSNVPTITNLVNRDRLYLTIKATGTPVTGPSGSFSLSLTENLMWARTPKIAAMTGNIGANSPSPSGSIDGYAGYVSSSSFNRYSASATVVTDWVSGNSNTGLQGYIDFNFGA